MDDWPVHILRMTNYEIECCWWWCPGPGGYVAGNRACQLSSFGAVMVNRRGGTMAVWRYPFGLFHGLTLSQRAHDEGGINIQNSDHRHAIRGWNGEGFDFFGVSGPMSHVGSSRGGTAIESGRIRLRGGRPECVNRYWRLTPYRR